MFHIEVPDGRHHVRNFKTAVKNHLTSWSIKVKLLYFMFFNPFLQLSLKLEDQSQVYYLIFNFLIRIIQSFSSVVVGHLNCIFPTNVLIIKKKKQKNTFFLLAWKSNQVRSFTYYYFNYLFCECLRTVVYQVNLDFIFAVVVIIRYKFNKSNDFLLNPSVMFVLLFLSKVMSYLLAYKWN